jgi:hypothetical protein
MNGYRPAAIHSRRRAGAAVSSCSSGSRTVVQTERSLVRVAPVHTGRVYVERRTLELHSMRLHTAWRLVPTVLLGHCCQCIQWTAGRVARRVGGVLVCIMQLQRCSRFTADLLSCILVATRNGNAQRLAAGDSLLLASAAAAANVVSLQRVPVREARCRWRNAPGSVPLALA